MSFMYLCIYFLCIILFEGLIQFDSSSGTQAPNTTPSESTQFMSENIAVIDLPNISFCIKWKKECHIIVFFLFTYLLIFKEKYNTSF